jgi:hypothetical protein
MYGLHEKDMVPSVTAGCLAYFCTLSLQHI